MAQLPGRKLRHDEILPLLSEIGAELSSRGLVAEIYVAGGAAIAVRHGPRARDMTDDVDGVFRKNQVILDVASAIASREGLQPDWVNDAFIGFLPGAEPDKGAEVHEMGGLTARFASDEFLLAMKMHAGREKDTADTHLLIRHLGLHRSADIAALTTRLYGDGSVPVVDYDDMRHHAMHMLRGIRKVDPTWPADPDDTFIPARSSHIPSPGERGKTSALSNRGSFRRKRNTPPRTSLGSEDT